MTYKEIYTALIDDTIRILGGPAPGETWAEAADRIHTQVNSPEVPNIHNLTTALAEAAQKAGEHSTEARIARNLIQNLQVAKNMSAKHKEYIHDTVDDHLPQIVESLRRYGNTAVSYHLIELLGSEAALQRRIQEAAEAPITLQVTRAADDVLLQEKLALGNKTRWILTRMLPLVTVTLEVPGKSG